MNFILNLNLENGQVYIKSSLKTRLSVLNVTQKVTKPTF